MFVYFIYKKITPKKTTQFLYLAHPLVAAHTPHFGNPWSTTLHLFIFKNVVFNYLLVFPILSVIVLMLEGMCVCVWGRGA